MDITSEDSILMSDQKVSREDRFTWAYSYQELTCISLGIQN